MYKLGSFSHIIWPIYQLDFKIIFLEFNQSHTVQDLAGFCAGFASGKNFELRAGFPPKPIDLEGTQSLKDAKLLNETIIQRLK